jgi:hypothetical protein
VVADERLGQELLRIARASIAGALGLPVAAAKEEDVRLQEVGATFVTIRQASSGALHGCIGTLSPRRNLAADVRSNAVAAAFLDPRSPPLMLEDYGDISIEVSLLGPIVPFEVESRSDALAKMRRDEGYVLTWGPVRGVLLPQVWDQCADASAFLRCLQLKAGLPPDFWPDGIRLSKFRLAKWKDEARSGADRAAAPHA